MQTSSNSSFPFAGTTDLAAQNALMQGLGFNPQNISTNTQSAMGGFIQNSQPIGYPVFDQSLQNNFQTTQNALNMNQLNPMLMQQSMGQQLQGFNMSQNQMASQLQMQQQMFGGSGNPSIIPSFGGDANQLQQMNSYGGMNPLLAQSLQGAQMQNMYGTTDAMNMAFQGMMSAQRGQLSNSERDNYYSNNNDGALRLNTVYVSNLPQNLDHEMLKNQFSKAGPIKLNSKSGMPMIWIFKDRGVPKGDALVTYENNSSASNAVSYFKEHDFNGRRIEVRIATNAERPILAPPSGGQSNGNMDRRGGGNQYKIESISRNNDYDCDPYDWQKREDDGFNKPRDFRNNRNNRGPDWICSKCNNNNFSWRESCNRCQEPKAENAVEVQKSDRGRGFNGNRSNNRTVHRNMNPRSQDGGPMRGPKRSQSRPEPY